MGDASTQSDPNAQPDANQGILDLYKTARAFQTLLENLPGMAYRCANDAHWTMEFVSDRCEAVTGCAPEALLANRDISYAELIHPEDRDPVRRAVEEALERRESFQIAYRIRSPDGGERWMLEQGCGVFDDAGQVEALEGYVTDITEQKRLQRELARAANMETLGQLSSGIAHDLNNILTAIVSLATFISQGASAESAARQDAQDIVDSALRAAHLTRRILAFSKRDIVQPRTFEVDPTITRLEGLLRRLMSEQVRIVASLDARGTCVRADPGQFEQILVNLVVNARDAMPEGGVVQIRTRLDGEPSGPPKRIWISVADTGCGIPESVRSRIFEPFFTTKEAMGTGLGLSTVKHIVDRLHGSIDVHSAVGTGTTISVCLPVSKERAEPVAESALPGPLSGTTETVVVVDDDIQVRRSVSRTLRRHGYSVLEPRTATEALMLIERGQNDVRLLITDIVMPVLSGPEIVHIARRAQPEIRVLFMSGHATTVGQPDELPDGSWVIPKPFRPQTLLQQVRKILDEHWNPEVAASAG